jgi:hypothetical protein
MASRHKESRGFVIEGLVVTAIITEVQSETLGINRLFCWLVDPPGSSDRRYLRVIEQSSGEMVFRSYFPFHHGHLTSCEQLRTDRRLSDLKAELKGSPVYLIRKPVAVSTDSFAFVWKAYELAEPQIVSQTDRRTG